MNKKQLIFFGLLIALVFSSNLKLYDTSHAVLIGINNYQNEDITDLGYAVEDAKNVARMLETKLGFDKENIHILLNEEATLSNIKNTLYEIAMSVDKNDRLLVFYAGHGQTIPLKKGGELGYLVPVDASLDNLYASGLSMKTIKEISDITDAKHTLFMIDACYGGVMTVGTRGLKKNDYNDEEKYLKKITSENASQIITAGRKGEKAQERAEWGSSAFTKELLAGIEDGLADADYDGYITADELGSFLSKRVFITSEENQTPVIGRYGSGEGEFVFINPIYVEEMEVELEEEEEKLKVEEGIDIITSKAGDLLQSSILRQNSEIKNLISSIPSTENSLNDFVVPAALDSSFVDPLYISALNDLVDDLDAIVNEDSTASSRSKKPFRTIKNILLPSLTYRSVSFQSYVVPMPLHLSRVSGTTWGLELYFTQLEPLYFNLKYKPMYNFNLERPFHDIVLTRHPYGLKNSTLKLKYLDMIVTNDEWMRDTDGNYWQTMNLGMDYVDHFIRKGIEVSYSKDISSKLRSFFKFNNSYETTEGLSYSMDWRDSMWGDLNTDNRDNFKSFKPGRNTSLDIGFSYNSMRDILSRSFSLQLEFEDSVMIAEPEVYLVAESPAWPSKRIKMELSSREDLKQRFESSEDDCKEDYCLKIENVGSKSFDLMLYPSISIRSINLELSNSGQSSIELNSVDFPRAESGGLLGPSSLITFNNQGSKTYPFFVRLATVSVENSDFCIKEDSYVQIGIIPDMNLDWGEYGCNDEVADTDELLNESKGSNKNIAERKIEIYNNDKKDTENVSFSIAAEGNISGEKSSLGDTTTSDIEIDSVFSTRFIYNVEVNLPPGTHAYRFLVDSTSYELEQGVQKRRHSKGGYVVSVVEVEQPYRFDIAYEYADRKYGSDFSYQRLRLKYAFVYPVSKFESIQFSLLGGLGKKTLPSQKLYYIGGGGSVRGFPYMSSKKYDGSNMLLMKLEYHFHKYEASIFYDLGYIGNDIDFSRPINSYGIEYSVKDFRDYFSADEDIDLNINLILYRMISYDAKYSGINLIYQYSLRDFYSESFLP